VKPLITALLRPFRAGHRAADRTDDPVRPTRL